MHFKIALLKKKFLHFSLSHTATQWQVKFVSTERPPLEFSGHFNRKLDSVGLTVNSHYHKGSWVSWTEKWRFGGCKVKVHGESERSELKVAISGKYGVIYLLIYLDFYR